MSCVFVLHSSVYFIILIIHSEEGLSVKCYAIFFSLVSVRILDYEELGTKTTVYSPITIFYLYKLGMCTDCLLQQ